MAAVARVFVPKLRKKERERLERGLAKSREPMRKYYYDPAKYPTYLDQLGIKYPAVRPR